MRVRMISKKRNFTTWYWRNQFDLECKQQPFEVSRVAHYETSRPLSPISGGTDVIAASTNCRKRVFIVRMLDGTSKRAIKLFICAFTVLFLLVISCCPKVQTLAVVGHISSSAANMAAAAASLLVAQGLQLEQQPPVKNGQKLDSGSHQQYRLTFEQIPTTNLEDSPQNGSLSLSSVNINRTTSENMYAERRNFGQRIPFMQNISESTFLGQLANPFKLNFMSAGGLEVGNLSNKKEGNNRLKLISKLLQYRLPRPNATPSSNSTTKPTGSNSTSTQNNYANIPPNGQNNSHVFSVGETIKNKKSNGGFERESLVANSSIRDYQVVRLAHEIQPETVTLEINGSQPDSRQESKNIEQVIQVGNDYGDREKKKDEVDEQEQDEREFNGGELASKGSRKSDVEHGDQFHGHEEADSWLKQKHGEQGEQGSGARGSKNGDQMLKDFGHKRHGWKNIYHKEEYAQHQKYHDLLANKDSHDKSDANEAQEHFNAGSKFNDTKSGLRYDKDDHGSKYEYVKGNQWRRQEEDDELQKQQQQVENLSNLQGTFVKKQRVDRKHNNKLKGPNNAFEESSSNELDFAQQPIGTADKVVPTQGDEQTTQADLDNEEPIAQMKDKLERLSARTRYQAAKRLTSPVNPLDSRAASEQTNYATTSSTSPNEQDYDDERDWLSADELAAGKQHESINDILKTVKGSRVSQSRMKNKSPAGAGQLDQNNPTGYRNSSGNLLASSTSELEPEEEDSGEHEGIDQEIEIPTESMEKPPKKNEQIRLKLELDLGKSMGAGFLGSGKGERGLIQRGRLVNGTKSHHSQHFGSNLGRFQHSSPFKPALLGRGGGFSHFSPSSINKTMSSSWRMPRPPLQQLRSHKLLEYPIVAPQQEAMMALQPQPGIPEHIEKAQQFYPPTVSSSSSNNNESRWSKAIGEGPARSSPPVSRFSSSVAGSPGLQDGQLVGYRGEPPTRRPPPANPRAQNSWDRQAVHGHIPAGWSYPPNPAQHHPGQHLSRQQPPNQRQQHPNLMELNQVLPERPIFVKHLEGGVVLGRLSSNNRSERDGLVASQAPPHQLNPGLIPGQIMMNPSSEVGPIQQQHHHHHPVMSALPLGLAEDMSLESSLNHALGDQLLSGIQTGNPLEQFSTISLPERGQQSPLVVGASSQRDLRDYLVGISDLGSVEGGNHPHQELSLSFENPNQVNGLVDMDSLLGEADSQQMMLSAFVGNSDDEINLEQQHPAAFNPTATGSILHDPLAQFITPGQQQVQQHVISSQAHQQIPPADHYLFPMNHGQAQESVINPAAMFMLAAEQNQQHQQHQLSASMIPAMQQTLARLLRLSRVFGGGVASIPASFLAGKQQFLAPPAQFHDYHALQRQFNMPSVASNLLGAHRRPVAGQQQQQHQHQNQHQHQQQTDPFGETRGGHQRWRMLTPHTLQPPLTTTGVDQQIRGFAQAIHPQQQLDVGDLWSAHSKMIASSVSSNSHPVYQQQMPPFLQQLREPVPHQNHQSTSKLNTHAVGNSNQTEKLHRSNRAPMRMTHSEKLMLRKVKSNQTANIQAPPVNQSKLFIPQITHLRPSSTGSYSNHTSSQAPTTTTQKSTTNIPHVITSTLSTFSNSSLKEQDSPLKLSNQYKNNNKQPLAWFNVPYISGQSTSYFSSPQKSRPSTREPDIKLSSKNTTTTPFPAIFPPASSTTSKAPFFGQKILANFKSKLSNVTG